MSLHTYIIKRTLVAVPVLLGVTLITFSMMHALPGDPINYITQFVEVTEETERELRAQYNLDRPVWEQYLLWLSDVIVLDFGVSIISDRNVGDAIMVRLPYTMLLGGLAWLLAMAIAIPAGIVSAIHKNDVIDEVSRFGALTGIAIPNFWLGLMLILVFAVWLGWFPVLPPVGVSILSLEMLRFLVLPVITLGTAMTALLMRLMRASMVEEINKDYVMVARAKGLPERTIMLKHVLRNSLIAVITVAALQIAFIVDGSVVIEEVFAWPGLGRLLVQAITQRDFPVVQATVLLFGVSIVLANLLADIIYALVDPRIKY